MAAKAIYAASLRPQEVRNSSLTCGLQLAASFTCMYVVSAHAHGNVAPLRTYIFLSLLVFHSFSATHAHSPTKQQQSDPKDFDSMDQLNKFVRYVSYAHCTVLFVLVLTISKCPHK